MINVEVAGSLWLSVRAQIRKEWHFGFQVQKRRTPVKILCWEKGLNHAFDVGLAVNRYQVLMRTNEETFIVYPRKPNRCFINQISEVYTNYFSLFYVDTKIDTPPLDIWFKENKPGQQHKHQLLRHVSMKHCWNDHTKTIPSTGQEKLGTNSCRAPAVHLK